MQIPAQLKSRKFWAFVAGFIAIIAGWSIGDVAGKQAINDLVALILGYVGIQGYQDSKQATISK